MKKKIIIIAVAVVLAAGLIFGGIKVKNNLPYLFDKYGINQPDTKYTLTIEKSDFENEVAKTLQSEGIIVSAVRFLGYIHKNHPDFVWYNGNYNLSADMSYAELCQKLKTPDSKIDYVKFTVPEGKNVVEISKIVEKSGLCTAEQFLEAADSYKYEFDFLNELEKRDSKKIGYKLEGFLFPATYEFRKDTATPSDIVYAMLKAFTDYVGDDIIKKASDMGLSVNELVTFASVIQAEAFSKESMANISSVFWNRLNSTSHPKLQSDPTMTYAKDLKALSHYSTAMAEAYDTYKCNGLPVGPTNCPGLDTIKAVINPANTEYYYFVTDKDGNFYFNKTYKEHVDDCYAIGLWKKK